VLVVDKGLVVREPVTMLLRVLLKPELDLGLCSGCLLLSRLISWARAASFSEASESKELRVEDDDMVVVVFVSDRDVKTFERWLM